MKPLKVYAYAKCSTCRKALRWLSDHGVPHEVTDIVESPPSRAELGRVLELSGLPLGKLFNTSGQSYRNGNWGERLKRSSQSEALDALAEDGKLIKRPLLLGDGLAMVGFAEAAYETKWGSSRRE